MTAENAIISTMTAFERLTAMRTLLQNADIAAYYVSPEDEHLNEYVPDAKKRIAWLTGFSGESAPALATADGFHVFVDGRFHLQVDDEVDANIVTTHKLGPDVSGDRQIVAMLNQQAAEKSPLKVGYDPFIVSPSRLKVLQETSESVVWVPLTGNFIDVLWQEEPLTSLKQAYALDTVITGEATLSKMARIRDTMQTLHVDVLPVTRLDEIAWLYNIRGGDIPYNPVVESYAILTLDAAYWCVDLAKIPAALQKTCQAFGIKVIPYTDYAAQLTTILQAHPTCKVLIDKGALTEGTLRLVAPFATIVLQDNPITLQKALKNPTEIARMQLANLRASRAIIRHLANAHALYDQGQRLTEYTLRADLEAKYQEEPEFVELSFPTIPGVGANSAIIHYSKADPDQVVTEGCFYLLDSGCQYLGGTTDTTRTTVFGTPTALQKQRYTAVLRAHIACANLCFPQGTRGNQIDAVCREPLWQLGLDFAHGTGHGVGAFANVHEGPNRISKVCSVVFQPGMVTSIEPGYYEKDWGGIRLENLYTVVDALDKTPFLGRSWHQFAPLTHAPFEKRLINVEALTSAERVWLTAHYQDIQQKLAPTLSPAEQAWLQDQCNLWDGMS